MTVCRFLRRLAFRWPPASACPPFPWISRSRSSFKRAPACVASSVGVSSISLGILFRPLFARFPFRCFLLRWALLFRGSPSPHFLYPNVFSSGSVAVRSSRDFLSPCISPSERPLPPGILRVRWPGHFSRSFTPLAPSQHSAGRSLPRASFFRPPFIPAATPSFGTEYALHMWINIV